MKKKKIEVSKTHASGIEVKEGDILEMWPNMLLSGTAERAKIVRLENGDLGYTYIDRKIKSTYSLKHNYIHGCKIIKE